MMWKLKTYMPFLAIVIGSFAAGFNCGVESLSMLNVYLTSLALLAFEGVR